MKSRLRKRRDMKKKSNTVESLSSISSESSDSEGDDSGESASSSGSDEEQHHRHHSSHRRKIIHNQKKEPSRLENSPVGGPHHAKRIRRKQPNQIVVQDNAIAQKDTAQRLRPNSEESPKRKKVQINPQIYTKVLPLPPQITSLIPSDSKNSDLHIQKRNGLKSKTFMNPLSSNPSYKIGMDKTSKLRTQHSQELSRLDNSEQNQAGIQYPTKIDSIPTLSILEHPETEEDFNITQNTNPNKSSEGKIGNRQMNHKRNLSFFEGYSLATEGPNQSTLQLNDRSKANLTQLGTSKANANSDLFDLGISREINDISTKGNTKETSFFNTPYRIDVTSPGNYEPSVKQPFFSSHKKTQSAKSKQSCRLPPFEKDSISKITDFLVHNNPFQKSIMTINDILGCETSPYFNFFAYFVFLNFFLVLIYIIFYVAHISTSKYDSKYQPLLSFLMSHNYSSSSLVSYAITLILTVFFQIVFTGMICRMQVGQIVIQEVQEQMHIRTFLLVFNSWNARMTKWRSIDNTKISYSLRIKNWIYRKKRRVPQVGDSDAIEILKKIAFFILIVILNLSLMLAGPLLCLKILPQNSIWGNISGFQKMYLNSVVVVILTFACEYSLKYLTPLEGWRVDSKFYYPLIYSKMFLTHLILIIFYYYMNIEQLWDFTSSNQSQDGSNKLLQTVSFDAAQFNCPDEQFVYSILSLWLGYITSNLCVSYLPTLQKIAQHIICQSSLNKFRYPQEIHTLDRLIPLICINGIGVSLSLHFPFIFIGSSVIMCLLYFHDYKQFLLFGMPSSEVMGRQSIINLGNYMYLSCNTLLFIFFGIALQANYTKKQFKQSEQNSSIICGAFSNNETPFDSFQAFVYRSSFIATIYDVFTFKPLLWTIIILLFFSYFLVNASQKIWKIRLNSKYNELCILKKYFQKQVTNLSEKQMKTTQSKTHFSLSPPDKRTPKASDLQGPINQTLSPSNINQVKQPSSTFSSAYKELVPAQPVSNKTGLFLRTRIPSNVPLRFGTLNTESNAIATNKDTKIN